MHLGQIGGNLFRVVKYYRFPQFIASCTRSLRLGSQYVAVPHRAVPCFRITRIESISLFAALCDGAMRHTHMPSFFSLPRSTSSSEVNDRVRGRERSERGRGLQLFVPHSKLALDEATHKCYLKNDTLYFRVSSVVVYISNTQWLTPSLSNMLCK
jgi:hypothetical protein